MDEYEKEISDLKAQIEVMVEEEADRAEIRELSLQLRVLSALYSQALRLFDEGLRRPELRRGLMLRGYGEWNLDSVYAFVFETAVELDEDRTEFSDAILATDFAALIG